MSLESPVDSADAIQKSQSVRKNKKKLKKKSLKIAVSNQKQFESPVTSEVEEIVKTVIVENNQHSVKFEDKIEQNKENVSVN